MAILPGMQVDPDFLNLIKLTGKNYRRVLAKSKGERLMGEAALLQVKTEDFLPFGEEGEGDVEDSSKRTSPDACRGRG